MGSSYADTGTSTPHVLLLDKQKGVRGSQYYSHDFQKRLTEYKMTPSMSGKGNCYDNAVVETFFKSLKAEMLWRQSWPTRRQATAAIFQYINGFYNPRRRHSYLGIISPLAFEAKAA